MRQYFSNRAHALYFLRCAAPTKLVDGAWLFNMLRRWDENACRPLIKSCRTKVISFVQAQGRCSAAAFFLFACNLYRL